MFCIIMMSKLIIHLSYFCQYLKNDKLSPRLLLHTFKFLLFGYCYFDFYSNNDFLLLLLSLYPVCNTKLTFFCLKTDFRNMS